MNYFSPCEHSSCPAFKVTNFLKNPFGGDEPKPEEPAVTPGEAIVVKKTPKPKKYPKPEAKAAPETKA